MSAQRDLWYLLSALIITSLLAYGLYYFVRHLWPLLPTAVALILFIALATAVIGYPIYALAQWSNRNLPPVKRDRNNPTDDE